MTIPAAEIRILLLDVRRSLDRVHQALEASQAAIPRLLQPHPKPVPRLSTESRKRLGALLPALYRAFKDEEFKLVDAWAVLTADQDAAVQAALQGMDRQQLGLRLAWAARATARIGQAAWGCRFVVTRQGMHHHSRCWRVCPVGTGAADAHG